MAGDAHDTHKPDIGYERLMMLTDGVFAIAITLLALEIRVPEVANRAELGQAILDMIPQILIFIFSFAQVGIFWLAHHRMFRHIERSDDTFMGLCLIYLMLIAFIPVPSATLGHYGNAFASVVFFALTLMLVGVAEVIIWEYAAHNHRLLRADVTALQIAETRWRAVNAAVIFGISILIAFVSPLLAILSWPLLFLTRALISRRFERLQRQADARQTAS
jgi:uncharacterized membrane protein